jgi:hypothetical protein
MLSYHCEKHKKLQSVKVVSVSLCCVLRLLFVIIYISALSMFSHTFIGFQEMFAFNFLLFFFYCFVIYTVILLVSVTWNIYTRPLTYKASHRNRKLDATLERLHSQNSNRHERQTYGRKTRDLVSKFLRKSNFPIKLQWRDREQ